MLDQLWQRLVQPLFFALPPELAHRAALTLLSALPPIRLPASDPALSQRLWDLDFANPIGLAAGMDKDVGAVGAWQALGFGFAEVGTITPMPQRGNPRPRLWRLPEQRALINRLGFPSRGMARAARRLARLRRSGISIRLGINLGPNRTTPSEKIAEDIAVLVRTLGPMADFIVVNLSSPNTPGLREWQAPDQLRELVSRAFSPPVGELPVGGSWRHPPVLVKVAPDLDPDQLKQLCRAALELRLDGIVATNTTVLRAPLGVSSEHPGGLSGLPLRDLARSIIREIYWHTEGRLPIIGAGGVGSADDAWEHIRAGATLVELYTGLIYGGPGLVRSIQQGLLRLLDRSGYHSIGEAVGRELR